MSDWIGRLKEGDEVLIAHGWAREEVRQGRVDRTTTTQVVVGHERFRRSDGRRVGDTTYRARLVESTPERMEVVERRSLVTQFKHYTQWDELPLETLRSVAALLASARPQSGEEG